MFSLDRGETAAMHLRDVLLVAQHSRAQEARTEGVHLIAYRQDCSCKILGVGLHCRRAQSRNVAGAELRAWAREGGVRREHGLKELVADWVHFWLLSALLPMLLLVLFAFAFKPRWSRGRRTRSRQKHGRGKRPDASANMDNDGGA